MLFKKSMKILASLVFVLLFSTTFLSGQLKELCKFKGVNLSYKLQHEDTVMDKGKYDLVVLRLKSTTTPLYYLKFQKGRKALCRIEGELSDYQSRGLADLMADPDVPDKPTLKLKRDPGEKVLIFTIQTGKKHRTDPLIRINFKIHYEE